MNHGIRKTERGALSWLTGRPCLVSYRLLHVFENVVYLRAAAFEFGLEHGGLLRIEHAQVGISVFAVQKVDHTSVRGLAVHCQRRLRVQRIVAIQGPVAG